jgi:hypothetical protein
LRVGVEEHVGRDSEMTRQVLRSARQIGQMFPPFTNGG